MIQPWQGSVKVGVEVRTVEEHESQSATTQDMQILRQLGAGLGDGREPKQDPCNLLTMLFGTHGWLQLAQMIVFLVWMYIEFKVIANC